MKVMSFSEKPIVKFAACVMLAAVVWMMDGIFDVPSQAWHLFAVFIAVIVSFIIRPFPMGMMVLIGLFALVATKTITITESLTGYGDSIVWLVVAAFLLSSAVLNTGIGRRIALWLFSIFGRSIKGLAYSVCASELLLAPVIPSNTARGGGLHAPIVNSLAQSLATHDSTKKNDAGIYLSLVGGHANLITSAMFMTAMAANPLITKAARDIFDIDFGWGTWALGAIVPGLVSLLLLPQFIYMLAKPSSSDGSAAREKAKEELHKMGPLSIKEKVMLVDLVLLVILWSTKFLHGLDTTLVAWIGVLILLLTNTQSWHDIITNEKAWDALIWLGGLLTMGNLLLEYGLIQWFVDNLTMLVSGMGGFTVIIILGIVYFYSMYAFSMMTAHISAMIAPFLSVCLAAGGEPMLAVAVFAYFSLLCGSMTNYSSGPIIIYFGLGYVTAPKWFKVGFLVSLFHLAVWFSVGMLWWKILGWW